MAFLKETKKIYSKNKTKFSNGLKFMIQHSKYKGSSATMFTSYLLIRTMV